MSEMPAVVPVPAPPAGGGLNLPGPPPPPAAATPMEVELRDHLGAALADAAIALTGQVKMLSADEDPAKCKDMAQACLYLTEALVLVAPLETPVPGQAPAPLPPKHMPPQASLHTAEQQATGRSA